MKQANTISAVVGERLRRWRKEARLTQDQVATAARGFGLDWKRGTVASIEGGHREVSLSEFLALPFLAQFFGSADSWNRLASFLPPQVQTDETAHSRGGDSLVLDLTETEVELASGCWIDIKHLRALVAGYPAGGRKVPKNALVTWGLVAEAASQTTALFEATLRDFSSSIAATMPQLREAEQKAAKKLGVSADAVLAAALTLWGKTLTDERDARAEKQITDEASPRRLQAMRGHVTRDLLDELRPVLKEKEETE